jgi:ADP-heptose:LPS heptosyltransferase
VESVLEQLERGSRVAVVRLRSLGDCVLTTPALDLLKHSRPDLQIAVVVEEAFSDIFQGNPDVFVVLGRQFVPLRVWRPHLCINFHGGQRSARLTAFSGARFRAGFEHYRHGWAYNVRIPRAQEILGVERKVHTAEHLASAVFYLGVEQCEIPRAKLIAEGRSELTQPYAVIHPFATGKGKAWPADRFRTVAKHLACSGLEPVFIGAATDDASAFAPYRTIRGARLSEINRLLSAASLFIGNDSGPAHMAAAFGLPVVVLFGASDPDIWGPWRTASEILASEDITSIEVNQVIDALSRLRVHA